MERRAFIGTLVGGLVAGAVAVSAQQAGKVARIGFLGWGPPPPPGLEMPWRDAFLQGLREFGYVEGHSIAIEYRYGLEDQLPALAADLVRLKVDVIVTGATPSALAAKRATQTIPIVALWVGDPVASGLVASLARPGGNVTGMSLFAPELFAKGLQLLKEAAPKISRVGVLMDPTNPGQLALDKDVQAAAKVLGVKAQRIDVKTGADLDSALAAARRERAEALLVFPVFVNYQRLAEFAIKNRLPTITMGQAFSRPGMLMSYGPNFAEQFHHAGTYVDKILKGAKPADLPVEQPTKFELVINAKTAKALGLTIPSSLLLRADKAIE
jgi:putative ABC transport system substrate-binding protein